MDLWLEMMKISDFVGFTIPTHMSSNYKIETTMISTKLISFRLTISKKSSLEDKTLCITVDSSLNLAQLVPKKLNLDAVTLDLCLILELTNMLI